MVVRHQNVMMLIIPVMIASPASGAIWQIPMVAQQPGGVDHVQIRFGDQYQTAGTAFTNFFAVTPTQQVDPRGFSWSETFLNNARTFGAASGPTVEDGTLAFNILVEGDRQVDRPSFHYQTYLEGELVGNFDIYCIGQGDEDWVAYPGTWSQDTPVPPFLPGDGDRDADVDVFDLINHWQAGYTGPGASGSSWEEGDWDGDGDTDIFDLINGWQANYTGPVVGPPPLASLGAATPLFAGAAVPEPATGLLAAALGLGLAHRSRRYR